MDEPDPTAFVIRICPSCLLMFPHRHLEESKEQSITCPKCNKTSHNPNDIREGYCGNCHAYTGTGQPR